MKNHNNMCHYSDSAQSYLKYADDRPEVIEMEKCCGCAEENLPDSLKGYTIDKLSGRFCVECIKRNQDECNHVLKADGLFGQYLKCSTCEYTINRL